MGKQKQKVVTPVRVKICCIASIDEAKMAIGYGADAIGLVSAMPSGPGVISERMIFTIAASTPPPVATFLLTSLQDAHAIVGQFRRCGTNTVQLCDRLMSGTHADIRGSLPGIKIVQVIHCIGVESLDEAIEVAPHVDALLIDSGNRSAGVKELGGTGRVHDWTISAQIVKRVSVPVFLAGGLTPENVGEAITMVQPFGVDVCSGVRSDGLLDPMKLKRFIRNSARIPSNVN